VADNIVAICFMVFEKSAKYFFNAKEQRLSASEPQPKRGQGKLVAGRWTGKWKGMRQAATRRGLNAGRRHVIAAAVQWFRIAFLGPISTRRN